MLVGQLFHGAIARKYATLERRRWELIRLEGNALDRLYKHRAWSNPEGYYNPEQAAQDMQRKVDMYSEQLQQIALMQRTLEDIIQETYSLTNGQLDEEIQWMLEEQEMLDSK